MHQTNEKKSRIIIEAHAHIYPQKIADKATKTIGDFYGIPMQHIGMPEELIKSGEQIGVSKYLVCSTATKPEQVRSINQYINTECIRHKQFVGFATMHPDMSDYIEELEFIDSCELRGIKLHPDFQKFNIDDPSAIRMYRLIAKRGLPILFHTGDNRYDFSAPKRLQRVLNEVPDLICIAAHFGGYQRWDEAHEYLKCKNVYFDTSSSLFQLDKAEAVSLIRYFGYEKFMFGSDFPMWDHKEELARFDALDLTESQKELILHENFEKLFPNEKE